MGPLPDGAPPPSPAPAVGAPAASPVSRLLAALPLPRRLPGWAAGLLYYREIIMRAVVTVGMLTLIRAGHFVPLPGVDLHQVPAVAASTAGERLIRALYGQAGDLPASLFDLGISPFVNASIVMAVLLVMPQEVTTLPLPGMATLARIKEARKEGRSGEAVLNSYINNMALVFAITSGLSRALELQPAALYAGGLFVPQTVLSLVAGSCIIHFCANTITALGLGNGSSLVICAGIISEYAATLHTVLCALDTSLVSAGLLAAILGGYLLLVLLAVFLSTSELRLPVVQYASSAPPPPDAAKQGVAGALQDIIAQARQLSQKKVLERGHKSDYFPLQLNSSGMMSIILGGAAYFGFLPKLAELLGDQALAAWLASVQLTPLGLLGYGLTVACLEFLPLGGINPKEMAEYFNMMNVGLKGVVPGEPTERELRTKLLQCKFWGGMCLGVLAVAAQLYDLACMRALGTTLATTSLLIIVGAVLQTARQVEGLLEGPKLQRKLDMERKAIQSLSLL